MCSQFSQGCRTVAHHFFQAVAFLALNFLLALVRLLQSAGLAQIHEKAEDTQRRHSGNANARQAQGLLNIGKIGAGLLVNVLQQRLAVIADGIHVLHTCIGEHDKAPSLIVALLVEPEAQVHLIHLALDLSGQRRECNQRSRVHDEDASQLIHRAVDGL